MVIKSNLNLSNVGRGISITTAFYGYAKWAGDHFFNLYNKVATDFEGRIYTAMDKFSEEANTIIQNADKVADKFQNTTIDVNSTLNLDSSIENILKNSGVPIQSSAPVQNIISDLYSNFGDLVDTLTDHPESYLLLALAATTSYFILTSRVRILEKRNELNNISKKQYKKYEQEIENEINEFLRE